ncbi:MAG TPA: Gfo/Idh/MocA family oxidoreductase [Pseudonocardia sp.]|jgi:predicted dehydrogenase
MRFGIVGCGEIGTMHAELIAAMPDRACLEAVADSAPAAARALGERYDARVMGGIAELCRDPGLDAISVCLPNHLHAEAAVAALRAGKHVVIEKPIDITLEAANAIIAAERDSGRTATVISQRRFQPAFAALHAEITAGRLGKIAFGSVHTPFWRTQSYYDSAGWRGTWAGEGGGALMNQGSHGLDLLLWLMGTPVAVSAFAGTVAHERVEVEDTLAGTIRFASGAVGMFGATTAGYPGGTLRLEVAGDSGRVVVEDEVLRYLHTRDRAPADPDTETTDQTDQKDGVVDQHADPSVDAAHAAQYRDFVDAVTLGRPPLVSTRDGRRVLAVMLAAYRSASRDGASVSLPAQAVA